MCEDGRDRQTGRRERLLEQALAEYVEKYGITDSARHALTLPPTPDADEPLPGAIAVPPLAAVPRTRERDN